MIAAGSNGAAVAPARLPIWLQVAGGFATAGTLLLAGRLAWEQTIWTWREGLQSVGFSLIHSGGGALFLCPVILAGCMLIAAVLTIVSLLRRRRVSWWRTLPFAVSGLAVIGTGVHYGFWQRVFIERFARSPHAAEFLIYDAAVGDFGALRALLQHGISVNASNRRTGTTALHAAAAEGRTDVIEFLVTNGANVNAIDIFGDSPLEVALAQKHDAAAKFLASRGAVRVRGDEARRDQVISEMVRQDMADMEGKDRKAR